MRRLAGIFGLTAALAALAASAVAAPALAAAPAITEISSALSSSAAPQGIAMGPDGNMWFAEFGADKIGRVTPAGVVTELALTSGSKPFDVAAGHDGAIWFSEWGRDKIGHMTTDGTLLPEISLSSGAQPTGIAADDQGRIWVTEPGINKVARYDPARSSLVEDGNGISGGATPRDIVSGPDYAMWFTEGGANSLGRHGLSDIGSTEQSIVSGEGIAAGADGALWFVSQAFNTISFLEPGVTGGNRSLPTASAFPEGVAAGPDGRTWFTELNGNRLGYATQTESPQEVTSGISPGASPFGIAAGPDGALWFTEFDANRIARATTDQDPFGFTAPARIPLPTAGSGSPPAAASAIHVAGLSGTVKRVRVRLNGVFMQDGSLFRALLVDPSGHALLLLDGSGANSDAAGAVMTFADDGMTPGQLVSGVYVPHRATFASDMPAPAPPGPYTTSLAALNGDDPNGTWTLYVARRFNDGGATDVLAGGWSLDIQTAPPQILTVTVPGPSGSGGSGGGSGGGSSAAGADTTPAHVTLAGVPRSLTRSRFLKGFRVRVTPDEPAALDVTLTGSTRKATIAALRLLLFERSLPSASGPRTLLVKPARAAVGRSRRTVKVTLRVVATDRGGNRTTLTRTILVRPDPAKRRRR